MSESGIVEGRLKDIKRRTRRKFNAEDKIRIVLEGIKGESSIADLCRREWIHANQYYTWSKEFREAGKQRLSGTTVGEATSPEVAELRKENAQLKPALARELAWYITDTERYYISKAIAALASVGLSAM